MSSNASIISRLIQPGGELISADETVAASGGVQNYATIAELPLADNDAGDQAFVEENDRLYIWTGAGWYNIALINQAPNITSGGAGSYTLATDGTPIVITLTAEDPEDVPITWSYQVTSGTLGNTTVVQADNVFTITPSTDSNDQGVFTITFTASDGVNIATDINSFSLSFADEYFANTVLLLQANDVTDGSQNNTFLDSSTNARTITRNGNVTQGSFSPFSQDEGKWGNYFDGSDYLSVSDDVSLEVGNSNFTLEAWVYMSSAVNTNGSAIIAKSNTSSIGPYALIIHPAIGDVSFAISTNGTNWTQEIKSGSTLSTHTWHHIAGVRNGDVFTLYVDGVAENSYTISAGASLVNNAENLQIGSINYPSTQFNGYISNARLVKGTAVYTSAFTPPTEPLTAITNTSLLTCQSNRFIDNSSNAHNIAVSGDTEVTPFSPFPSDYDPATKGGSGYFDGSGDYLTIPSGGRIINSGDFCIEAWIYPTNISAVNGGIFQAGLGRGALALRHTTNGRLALLINEYATHLETGVGRIAENRWQHVAVARDGNDLRIFVNGRAIALSTSSNSDFNNLEDSNAFVIGTRYYYDAPAEQFHGYISDLRFVTGTAVYTSDFTPPTAPLTAISGTSILCNFTNAGIYDTTGRTVLETAGNAQVDTAVKKYGTGSMQFDGTGDGLELKGSTNLYAFGTGDFTIEMWVYVNAFTNQYSILYGGRPVSTNGAYVHIAVEDDGRVYLYVSAGERIASPVSTITTGQWYHIALARSGTSTKLFVDGTQVGSTYTDTTNYLNVAGRPRIGFDGFSASPVAVLNGYIDDLRVTKGVARYTANFTPAEALLPDL